MTILTIYRNDIPQARAQWSARYEATPAGFLTMLGQAARYTGAEYHWFVTVINVEGSR